MPPVESNLSLTAREKAVLIRWVEEGAEFEPHWAFQAPSRPEVPQPMVVHAASLGLTSGSHAEEWATGEIDQFVLARFEREGLEPNHPAAPETFS